MQHSGTPIAVVGLGYVGLPLAVEFGRIRNVIGFDINESRINELKKGVDRTLETTDDELKGAIHLSFSNNLEDLKECKIFIITVPTPINKNKEPDLIPLKQASNAIGSILKKGDIVIYESTVYPGATEEVCVPILQKKSGLIFNKEFYCGYSPERINPGDKEHRITTIKKVTSGSTPEIAKRVDELYQEIITEGTFMASSIKVAEAAKVIENTQRDVNIALINELSLIFNELNIDTKSVLEAAGTKWNFLPFSPGLVGGHCIGVDPYYLTHKALEVGYKPEMILAGRKINDNMSIFVADQVSRLMSKKGISIKGANILIMGLSFKENCPDIRNTKVVDLIKALKDYGTDLIIHDPWADENEVLEEYGLSSKKEIPEGKFDAIVLTVAHNRFKEINFSKIKSNNSIIYDLKNFLDNSISDKTL